MSVKMRQPRDQVTMYLRIHPKLWLGERERPLINNTLMMFGSRSKIPMDQAKSVILPESQGLKACPSTIST